MQFDWVYRFGRWLNQTCLLFVQIHLCVQNGLFRPSIHLWRVQNSDFIFSPCIYLWSIGLVRRNLSPFIRGIIWLNIAHETIQFSRVPLTSHRCAALFCCCLAALSSMETTCPITLYGEFLGCKNEALMMKSLQPPQVVCVCLWLFILSRLDGNVFVTRPEQYTTTSRSDVIRFLISTFEWLKSNLFICLVYSYSLANAQVDWVFPSRRIVQARCLNDRTS